MAIYPHGGSPQTQLTDPKNVAPQAETAFRQHLGCQRVVRPRFGVKMLGPFHGAKLNGVVYPLISGCSSGHSAGRPLSRRGTPPVNANVRFIENPADLLYL
jgi:hypothetical protein